MNDPTTFNTTTFWRICDSQGVCHCDYRLTIYHCVEQDDFYKMNLAVIIATALGLVAGIPMLAWRTFHHKQNIFDIREGIPRPKPVESLCFFIILFNIVRIIHAVITLTDVAPYPPLRLFIFDLCWVFALNGFVSYVFGVTQTLLTSNRVLYDAWISSPKFVDILGVLINILPYIFMNVGSIGSGIFAAQNNYDMAFTFLRVGYFSAAIYTCAVGISVIYFGQRLISLMNEPLLLHSNIPATLARLKASSFKVKVTVTVGSIALGCMCIIASVYGSIYTTATTNRVASLFLSSFISFLGPIASFIILVVIFLSPNVLAGIPKQDFDDDYANYPSLHSTSQDAQLHYKSASDQHTTSFLSNWFQCLRPSELAIDHRDPDEEKQQHFSSMPTSEALTVLQQDSRPGSIFKQPI
ncbi:hypothetical protein DM01DRAFT_1333995 [Hesseltinella vesiculosa]|uniref:Transmembrane protein n=1 Tax=Hesseltinella vesiculosa TaxID=101127 RepID=A0A1X2GMG8_9FUNG|nr:hypothetical protein DM01DRAFT_1333995 [Hesseltinella vesiculosa]